MQGAIGYDKTWRVFVNATQEDLQGSAGLGRRKAIRMAKLEMLTRRRDRGSLRSAGIATS